MAKNVTKCQIEDSPKNMFYPALLDKKNLLNLSFVHYCFRYFFLFIR